MMNVKLKNEIGKNFDRELEAGFRTLPSAVSVARAGANHLQRAMCGGLLLGWLVLFNLAAVGQSVVISEFMAANSGEVRDENGDSSDWIELFNQGDSTINLAGWSLTDDPAAHGKWLFPAVDLGPKQFLLVFASGKNRADLDRPLHTNFKLDAAGEYLALVRPDGSTVAHHYAPGFPAQRGGLSYGIAMVGLEIRVLETGFLTPSPGSPNGSFIGFDVAITDLGFSPLPARAGEAIKVRVRVQSAQWPIQEATLFYRVMFGPTNSTPMADDGIHEDGAAGDGIYGAVILGGLAAAGEMVRWYVTASDTAGSRARLPDAPGLAESPRFLGVVIPRLDQSTDLPVMDLFIPPEELDAVNRSATAVASCVIQYRGEFYDNVRLGRHGDGSTSFPKKSYNLDFNREQPFGRSDLEARVDGVYLISTSTDKTHLRNVLAYDETFKPAGVPGHWVEPIRVQTNGGFYGIWHLMENDAVRFLERNGRDPRGALYRVHNTFTALAHTTVSEQSAEKKTRREEGNADLVALFNGVVAEPDVPNRVAYLHDHVDIAQMVNSLAARAVTSDLECCMDNYYLYHDADSTGEWQSFQWDLDLTFGRRFSDIHGYWDSALYAENRIWGRWDLNGLFRVLLDMPVGVGSGATRQMYLRRVRTLMDELQQDGTGRVELMHYEQAIDEWAGRLDADAALDLARWGTWAGGVINIFDPAHPFYQSFPAVIAELKTNYMANRRRFVFERKMDLPAEFPEAQPADAIIGFGAIDYHPATGNQAEEYIQLINTNAFAVDLSGWRLSGAIEHTFQGGVVIPTGIDPVNSLYVVADKRAFRARSAGPSGKQGLRIEGNYRGQLSARGEAITLSDRTGRIVSSLTYPGTPTLAQRFLRVSEINHHPGPGPGADQYARADFAFIELINLGPETMDLSRVRMVGSIQFDFSQGALPTLGSGQRLVLVQNRSAFARRYGNSVPVAGQFAGSFSVGGGRIRVEEAGENVLDFEISTGWIPMSDGAGFTLEIIEPAAEFGRWKDPAAWRCSGVELGSPGQADPGALPGLVPAVVINEALTSPGTASEDTFIEIHNPTAAPVDVSHWYLSDAFAEPRKYRLPAGTIIPASGYKSFSGPAFGAGEGPPVLRSFALNASGGSVWLFSGDANGGLTGYSHGFDFRAGIPGMPFGRHVNSVGAEQFVAQSSSTEGRANPGPEIGPVVISEIHYQPLSPAARSGPVDEFIELANVTDGSISLFEASHSTNAWRIDGRATFVFSAPITLAPHGHVVIVAFDPANLGRLDEFRARFKVPPETPVFGPFTGRLGAANGPILLLAALSPISSQGAMVVVDEIAFQTTTPWPELTDGSGGSLQRVGVDLFGNEPTNWVAGLPTPGRARLTGLVAPAIVESPANTLVVAGQSTYLSVTATGSEPLFFQWRHNGTNVPGANEEKLTFTSVRLRDAGEYSCTVFNSVGSVRSSVGQLEVVLPPAFTVQPADVSVRVRPDRGAAPSTNATFQVSAVTSHPPLSYQWQFRGTNIPGATNREFTVIGVTTNHLGALTCTISDRYSAAVSSQAWLYPLVLPLIQLHPVSQSVAVGQTVTLSCSVAGFPPPFTFEWRRNGIVQATNVHDSTLDTYTFLADVAPGAPLGYRAVVKNRANQAPGAASAIATITTLRDTDGDSLPDDFEQANGLNPNDPKDAIEDVDGDGMSNREEYVAGTDPLDPASVFRIQPADPPFFGAEVVSFGAVAGRTYTVQARNSLAPSPWRSIATVPATTTNRWVVVPDPTGVSNVIASPRIYRLVTPARPAGAGE